MTPETIIQKYYTPGTELYDILTIHSRMVAEKAVAVCDRHPELYADRQFVWEAAMLHDIGIIRTDAPGIHCHGTDHYLRHGLLGAEMLRAEGLPRHARVAERHTGTGLTLDQIRDRQLPLPLQDFSPETIEEQIICYADKFYSKGKPNGERVLLEQAKSAEQVICSLLRFGEETTQRFLHWQTMFE